MNRIALPLSYLDSASDRSMPCYRHIGLKRRDVDRGYAAPWFESQMFLNRVAYSIFLAPKYSLQYWAVSSGGYSLQEKTSMNALSVSSAKCPAMQDVSMSWIRE